MSVRVITDSSAIVPRAWTEDLPLHVVPLQIAWGNGETADGDRGFAELAERLAEGERPPTTSAPSPGAYEELYRRLLETDDELLVVCPPAELSTTYGNALLAARSAGEERVKVLDAKTAAAGQGLVALAAAETAAASTTAEDVLSRALDVAARVQMWATLSQLDFLRRSGRVPAVAAVGAGALGLQPVVRYTKGSPTPVGVTRSARRGADRIFRAWARSTGGRLRLVVFHSDRAAQADELCARVREREPDARAAATEVSASLGAHTGPGLLGLAWHRDP